MFPERCFCGCGEPRRKLDEANIEGVGLWMELARYVSYLAVMKQAGGDIDRSNLNSFLEDGRELWLAAYDAVHHGAKWDRKTRKTSKRWIKFSRKSRDEIARQTEMPFDPFGIFATPQQVRTWVVERELPAVEDLPDP